MVKYLFRELLIFNILSSIIKHIYNTLLISKLYIYIIKQNIKTHFNNKNFNL